MILELLGNFSQVAAPKLFGFISVVVLISSLIVFRYCSDITLILFQKPSNPVQSCSRTALEQLGIVLKLPWNCSEISSKLH